MKYFSICLALLFACSPGKENVMPFRNMVFSAERLFPIQTSSVDTALRIWINNSTSIDRVITVAKDSIFGNQGILVEFGHLSKKSLFGRKTNMLFREQSIIPKSGFNGLFNQISKLGLINVNDQTNFEPALHQPFSLYIIETKVGSLYNKFVFRSNISNIGLDSSKYGEIEKMIFEEFEWTFYK